MNSKFEWTLCHEKTALNVSVTWIDWIRRAAERINFFATSVQRSSNAPRNPWRYNIFSHGPTIPFFVRNHCPFTQHVHYSDTYWYMGLDSSRRTKKENFPFTKAKETISWQGIEGQDKPYSMWSVRRLEIATHPLWIVCEKHSKRLAKEREARRMIFIPHTWQKLTIYIPSAYSQSYQITMLHLFLLIHPCIARKLSPFNMTNLDPD